jgi:hypothetical protein
MNEFDYILKEFKEEISKLTDVLSRGSAKTYDEYQYICGKIRGLESAVSITQNLKERLENNDE